MALLSIVVPVYNTEKYLRRCLDSILGQTFKDYELIIVDDGSTDSCPEICDEYSAINKTINVIHKENGGLVNARKKGVEVATGRYITYVDSDDWVDPDAYSYMVNEIEINSADLVVCDRFIENGNMTSQMHNMIKPGVYGRGRIQREVLPNIISDGSFLKWNIYPSLCDKLFVKQKLTEYQLAVSDNICEGEDAAVSVPYIAGCNKIVFSNRSFYHYSQHVESMVKKKHNPDKDRYRYIELYNSLEKSLIKDSSSEKMYRKQIVEYIQFIAIPRITGLIKNYDDGDRLFPFTDVRKSEKIYLYGAGVFGFNMYRYLFETGFCKCLGILDRNYNNLSTDAFNVIDPKTISNIDENNYDHIVVSVMDTDSQNSIRNTLVGYGVDNNKISVPNMDFINKWCIWKDE